MRPRSCRYAIEQRPHFWEMPDRANFEAKQLYNTIREYTEQTNHLNNLGLLPIPSKDTIKSLQKMKQLLQKEVDGLENNLEAILKQWQPAPLKSVSSIKGIDKPATAILIVFTQGFKNTHNHRQLISLPAWRPLNTAVARAFMVNQGSIKKERKLCVMCSICVP